MTCGVYKITNLVNGKCYVGSSKNIESRWKGHLNRTNAHLGAAFEKYGVEKFEFSILKVCTAGRLLYWEQKFMDSLHPEYNQSGIAGRIEMTEEVKKKISSKMKNNPFYIAAMKIAMLGNKNSLGAKHPGRHRTEEQKLHQSNVMQGNQYAKEWWRKKREQEAKDG